MQALFLMPHPPWSGWIAQERLDVLLMALAFELEVRVAFVGPGVWQLASDQGAGEGAAPPYVHAYRSLELYGVAGVLAESESLAEAGLDPDGLIMPVELIAREDLRDLMERQGVLL